MPIGDIGGRANTVITWTASAPTDDATVVAAYR